MARVALVCCGITASWIGYLQYVGSGDKTLLARVGNIGRFDHFPLHLDGGLRKNGMDGQRL